MMTRKDYVKTAEIIRGYYESGSVTIENEEAFDEMIDKFVKYFESDNPNFKGDRFWDAIYN